MKSLSPDVVLNCPTCDNENDPYCNCTKQQFLNKLSEDPNFTNKPTNDVAALFGCSGYPTTYSFSTSEWNAARREIEASNIWLHGANVLVTPETACYPSGQEDNPTNNSTNCPDTGSGANTLFMRITGSNVGITGFTVKGFVTGLQFSGTNGTAGAMTFDRQCDKSVQNEGNLGIGNEVRNSVIRRGCDKCTEDSKGPNLAQPCSGRGCFHIGYYDTKFIGCQKSIRLSSGADNGRFTFNTVTDRPLGACSNNGSLPCSVNADCGTGNTCNVVWGCHGAEMGVTGLETTISGMTVEGCTTGLTLGTGVHTVNGQTRLVNQTERGLSLQGNAIVTIRDTMIVNNGGASDVLPGGLVATENSKPDLGNASTEGRNCIYDNKTVGGAGLEISNRHADYKLKAHSNWWNNGGSAPAQSELPRLCTDLVTPCVSNTDCGGSTCNIVETNTPLGLSAKPSFCN